MLTLRAMVEGEEFWRRLWNAVLERCGDSYCVAGTLVRFEAVKAVVMRAIELGVDDEDAIARVVAEGLAVRPEDASKLVNLVLADYEPEV